MIPKGPAAAAVYPRARAARLAAEAGGGKKARRARGAPPR